MSRVGFLFCGHELCFVSFVFIYFLSNLFLGLLEQSYNGDENCFGLDFLFDCLGIGVCCGWFGFFDLLGIGALFVW